MRYAVPLAVLLAVGIVGCKSDPYAKYRDAQLRTGMTIDEIKEQFGEPDCYRPEDNGRSVLNYGAFGAHHQSIGHVTRYRLSLTFWNGKLRDWEKSTPVGRE